MLRRVNPLDAVQRGIAEFVGTFALIFVAAGATIYGDLVGLAFASGLVIAVMVTSVAHISGAHFNPAVTLGFFVTRRIGPVHAILYWIVQFGAAALAALLLDWVLPESAAPNLGAPTLNSAIDTGQGVTIEAVLTFFLVWVIFATLADDRASMRQVAGLAIGFAITMGTLMAAGLTGAAMNPARAFGPELVANSWDNWWIWFVGPLAGGVIAAVLFEVLYLRRDEPQEYWEDESDEAPADLGAPDEPAPATDAPA
jgi:MIP family channel proteins